MSSSLPSSDSKLIPIRDNSLLSVCIPAHNEEGNLPKTIDAITAVLTEARIPFEFVIANDNSKDRTEAVIREKMEEGIPIRLINRIPPGGYGRAVRSCLTHFRGDIAVIVMADMSDDPRDIVKYYRKINEGYDAVFGSRFLPGSVVKDYPPIKLIANRLGNKLIQLLFRTKHNDITNAFKAFRREAIQSIMPLYASHFNLTIEISLGLLVRGFRIGAVPINWYGRTWGQAKFKIRELGRRYFATLFKVYAERIFILDDLLAEHEVVLQRVSGDPRRDREEVITNIDAHETNIDNRWGGLRRVEPSSRV